MWKILMIFLMYVEKQKSHKIKFNGEIRKIPFCSISVKALLLDEGAAMNFLEALSVL